MTTTPPRVIRFGDFEVYPAARVLCKSGQPVDIQWQPFLVLVALLDRPNQVVTREELIEKIWPDKGYGEFDLGLNTAIRKVRQALDESASEPNWLHTIPKIGYRFDLPPSPEPSEPDAPAILLTGGRRPWVLAAAGLAVVLSALTLMLVGGDIRVTSAEPKAAELVIAPLTSYPGFESHPALSPDGERIAFVWNGEDRRNDDVYVRSVDGGALTRVTDNPAPERFPVWSPDGRSLAFLRPNAEGAALVTMTLADPGVERELTQVRIGGAGQNYGLDWSPDGRFLAVQDMETSAGRRGIFLVVVETGEKRRLTTPPAVYFEDRWPCFSPDGRSLAFARGRTTHMVYVLDLDREGWPVGEAVRLTQEPYYVRGVDWAPNGRSLVFAGVAVGGEMELRSVEVGSKVSLSLLAGVQADLPSVVRRKSDSMTMLAFVHVKNDNNLYRFAGPAVRPEGSGPAASSKFVSSTRYEHSPRYSPDGKMLAFVSHRSGGSELWTAHSDGSNVTRMTHFGGRNGMAVGSPRWSYDNRWIAFETGMDGHEDLFLVHCCDGSEPRRLTTVPSNEVRPSFSHDGKWLYFTSDRTGEPEIWKMPVQGGEPSRLTHNGGQDAFESADGQWLYYAKRYGQFGDKGVYRMPVQGGEEEQVLAEGRVGRWALSATGLYLYRQATEERPAGIDYYPHDTLKPRSLTEFSRTSQFGTANALTVTPDDRWVVFVQKVDPGADLTLVRVDGSDRQISMITEDGAGDPLAWLALTADSESSDD